MSVSSALREDKNVLYFHLFEAEAEAEAQTEDESEYDNYYFWLRDSQQIAWSWPWHEWYTCYDQEQSQRPNDQQVT